MRIKKMALLAAQIFLFLSFNSYAQTSALAFDIYPKM